MLIQPVEARKTLHLVWRLVLATAFATGVLTAGMVLTAAALAGGSFSPNPLVALSVLFGGLVLTATLVAALRGD